jgi:hypothetical protein
MTRLFLMTWIHVKRRWNKHYKGKMYCVTTKALGVPPTPMDSYQAANAWWLAKQAAIDRAAKPVPLNPGVPAGISSAVQDEVGNV